MNDICYENGWYEYDDYEDYEMEESTWKRNITQNQTWKKYAVF
jgi:hypothetical protein